MTDQELYKSVSDMIDELRSTSGVNDKINIIQRYVSITPEITGFLITVYDDKSSGTTSESVKDHPFAATNLRYTSIWRLVDDLKMRILTGHDALEQCLGFRLAMGKYGALLDYLIDGDLKCGVNVGIIEKALNHKFKFGVCLAKPLEKFPDWSQGWYVSRKLDGVRCVSVNHGLSGVSLYSRTGKLFKTLGTVESELSKLCPLGYYIDGEICLDNGGNDDFQGVMKQINRKNHTIQNVKFKVFDMIHSSDYGELWSYHPNKFNMVYSDRYQMLLDTFKDSKIIEVVHHEKIRNDEHFNEWANKAEKENWEGLMLRADAPFEAKRTKNLLKYKKFFDDEYVVVGTEIGKITVNNNGSTQELMLSSVVIEHKGFRVNVGSGFSLEQRREFYYNPEKIIGKTITVKYFEETKDQNGNISLRFPTLKAIHGHQREV